MYLTKEELRLSAYAIVYNLGEERATYDEDLGEASTAFKAINASVDGEGNYVDGDIDFSTSQKALMLRRLKRAWPAADGEFVLSLREKLEK